VRGYWLTVTPSGAPTGCSLRLWRLFLVKAFYSFGTERERLRPTRSCRDGRHSILIISWHLTVAAFGLSALLKSALLFFALRYVGAACSWYLRIQRVLNQPPGASAPDSARQSKRGSPFDTIRRACTRLSHAASIRAGDNLGMAGPVRIDAGIERGRQIGANPSPQCVGEAN